MSRVDFEVASRLRLCLALALAGITTGALAQSRLEGLGSLAGGDSRAFGLNLDGTIVVGISDARAFKWSTATGMAGLDTPGFSVANAVSADGLVVVGQANFPSLEAHAFRWTIGGLDDLGSLGGYFSTALGVSHDGSTIVGLSLDSDSTGHAFAWTFATGMISLDPAPGFYSVATGISADGSIVIGTIGTLTTDSAFARSAPDSFVILGTLPGDEYATPNAVNANGSVVVGSSHNAANTNRAFRWTAAGGMEDLLTLPGGSDSFAYGVDTNGTTVVGRADASPGDSRAFRWTRTSGILDLNTFLASHGVNLTGWVLREARGVSGDGAVLVGFGDHLGRIEAWRAVLCLSDFNGDGLVNDEDAQIFIAAYNILDCADPEMPAGCPVDLNGDGIVNDKDFEIFIVAYDTLLCP